MSIISTIFVASEKEALDFVNKQDTCNIPYAELGDITDLELSILWAIIDEIEFDFDEHELEYIETDDVDDNLYRLPDSFLFSLCHLSEEDISAFSSLWIKVEEMNWPLDEVEQVLTTLVSLAQEAQKQTKSLYLYIE